MRSISITQLITSRDSEALNTYFKEVSKIKSFTPQEEAICALKAFEGDESARKELVTRNLKFVISVAKQYVTPQTQLADLVNEGNIGLIMAAERFNPSENVKFISYAVWWIRKLIIEHINKHNRMIRLPLNKITALSKIDKKLADLEQKNGYKTDINEIAHEITGDEFEFLDILTSYKMDSLDKELGGHDGEGNTLLDLISDDSSYSRADRLVDENDHKKAIYKGLDKLKPRDKEIMISLFGLNNGEPKTLDEVSREFDMSREMIRQIKKKSLLKMSKDKRLKLAFSEL